MAVRTNLTLLGTTLSPNIFMLLKRQHASSAALQTTTDDRRQPAKTILAHPIRRANNKKTNKQTVTDLTTPRLSACVDNKLHRLWRTNRAVEERRWRPTNLRRLPLEKVDSQMCQWRMFWYGEILGLVGSHDRNLCVSASGVFDILAQWRYYYYYYYYYHLSVPSGW